jgi:hypothetical protein
MATNIQETTSQRHHQIARLAEEVFNEAGHPAHLPTLRREKAHRRRMVMEVVRVRTRIRRRMGRMKMRGKHGENNGFIS